MANQIRQRWFLGATGMLGLFSLLVGMWEFWLCGALHQLANGTVLITLTVIADRWWRSPPVEDETLPA